MPELRVLVVEDDFVTRKLLMEMLQGQFLCDGASDGQEALEAYNFSVKNGTPYAAIILDISMPRVSGPQALRLIREAERKEGLETGHGVPVMVLTAHKSAVVESFKSGCDGYMVKPVSAAELSAKIMGLIK
ncbi:MAG: response regulator, partial [Elusimicrobia bacterium]|nr:response regulator [Elusimicrobiota bacterium]